jgi:hypothetical protein
LEVGVTGLDTSAESYVDFVGAIHIKDKEIFVDPSGIRAMMSVVSELDKESKLSKTCLVEEPIRPDLASFLTEMMAPETLNLPRYDAEAMLV